MRFSRPVLALILGAALCGCARVETVDLPGGGSERGPVFDRDGQAVRHGVWTATHPDGSRRSKVRYVRGVRAGLYQEWHPNGAPAVRLRLGWDGQPVPGEPEERWTPDGAPVEPPQPAGKTEEKTHG